MLKTRQSDTNARIPLALNLIGGIEYAKARKIAIIQIPNKNQL